MLREATGGISRVMLDPIPQNVFSEAYGLLLSVDFREFMDRLASPIEGLSYSGPASSRVGGGNVGGLE